MSIQASFDNSPAVSYLKPHIAIECFVGELLLDPQIAKISSLVKVTLGDECDHPIFPVSCVALDETAAEKWVALTRRIANTQQKSRESDKHLVRHLYDLYHLHQKKLVSEKYIPITHTIIEKDREMFKNMNEAYAQYPLRTSQSTLDILLMRSNGKIIGMIF